MFGVSLSEFLLVLVVAIVVVGPKQLPRVLGTVGTWVAKLRRMATDMRAQTGIDEILRAEGLHGGLNELRAMMRGDLASVGVRPAASAAPIAADLYGDIAEYDRSREYPTEGPDAYGAIPEDLLGDLAAAAPPPVGAVATELPSPPPTADSPNSTKAAP